MEKNNTGYWLVTQWSNGQMVQDLYPQTYGTAEGEHPLSGLISLTYDRSARTWQIEFRKNRSQKNWDKITGKGDYPELKEAIELRKNFYGGK